MTRLTFLYLAGVRGSNSEPIPFPTQFCNLIYLQRFYSSNNNFSGFENNCWCFVYFYPSSFTGQIPIDLTKLVGLKSLSLGGEPFLEGYFE